MRSKPKVILEHKLRLRGNNFRLRCRREHIGLRWMMTAWDKVKWGEVIADLVCVKREENGVLGVVGLFCGTEMGKWRARATLVFDAKARQHNVEHAPTDRGKNVGYY